LLDFSRNRFYVALLGKLPVYRAGWRALGWSMNHSIGTLPDPKGPFPGMLNFVHEPISTTLTDEQGELLINLLLQFLWIRFLNLIHEPPQLAVDLLLRLQKQSVITSENFDMDHIVQAPEWKLFAASPTPSFTHLFVLFTL